MSVPKGMSGTLNVFLSNYAEVKDRLEKKQKAAEKAVKKTVSDFKSRAPACISASLRRGSSTGQITSAISAGGSTQTAMT